MTTLAEIKSRLEKATPGVRLEEDKHEQLNLYDENNEWIALFPHQCVVSLAERAKINADFYLNAPSDIKFLLGKVEELSTCLSDVRQNLQAIRVDVAKGKSPVMEIGREMDAIDEILTAGKE